MANPPRARSQADALVARNQEQLSLLRLPGELRNKIYQHLFSDLIIEVVQAGFKTQPSIRNHKLTDPTMSRDAFEDCFEDLHEWVNITLASRQLYADTHLFLFEASSLRLRGPLDRIPSDMYELLTRAQLDAISSVRLYHLIEHHRTGRWVVGTRCMRPSALYYWAWEGVHDPTVLDRSRTPFKLSQFPRLKTVIVEDYSPTADKVSLEKEIKDNAGKQDLKIVYE